jgi:CDP-glycerol glycerophosphotransferase
VPLREPLLSVVLPVYNVREYLPVCLDSLLGVPGVGGRLEVVAVDDCSPDGCGELLDEVAERDGRLRVLHLAENVGLGGARQAGLEVAEGRFVWFVDSDDWLPEGALVAVLGALEATDPQVLLFDYESVFPDGRREGDRWRAALSSPAKPAVFAAVEHPEVLRLVMTAWSRVLRRDYLVGLGVRFGPGFYEDISVTYPSLVAAERVSVLDRVCYCYRRGRVGAITATSSSRHAEVFAQYARIFAFLDGHPGCEPFRAAVFGRTVRHAATLLELPGLVPAGQRRAFFAAISEHARVRRPAGWRPGGGVWGVRERLILGGRYRVYAVLVAGIRARREARAVVRGVVREGGVLRRKARAAVGVARYRVIAGTRGVDERLAVFAAYWYRGYACNPASVAGSTRCRRGGRMWWLVRGRICG